MTESKKPGTRRTERRGRARVLAERKRIALRLPAGLYDRLADTSDAAAMPHNAIVSAILETAVIADVADEVREHIKNSASDRDPDRVTLSIRLLPSLYRDVTARAKTYEVSVNSFVVFYVGLALQHPDVFRKSRAWVLSQQ